MFKPWDSESSAKSSLAFVIESCDEWISSSGITIHVCEAVVMWTIMFGKKDWLTIFSLETNNISVGQTSFLKFFLGSFFLQVAKSDSRSRASRRCEAKTKQSVLKATFPFKPF